MQMPPLDPAILARRSEIVAALRAIVPGEGVIDDLDGMRPYECDALSAYRQMPLVVVLPETVVQVSSILRCRDNKVKVVPRGAGTSARVAPCRWATPSCWASASSDACSRSTTPTAACACSPASPTRHLRRGQHEGFYYAPDPSSQIACSVSALRGGEFRRRALPGAGACQQPLARDGLLGAGVRLGSSFSDRKATT
jgi:glycolate oxidase